MPAKPIYRHPARARAEALLAKRQFAAVRLTLPGWCDAVDRYLIATYETVTLAQQAQTLGVPNATANLWRQRLAKAGLVDPMRRAGHRPITDAEAQTAARLAAQGFTGTEIAALRGITRERVWALLKRAGVSAPGRSALGPLTVASVAALFDVPETVVYRWIDLGWLPDERINQARGRGYGWRWPDVLAVVENRDTWLTWEPRRITHPTLRREAEDIRRRADGDWYGKGAIATLLNISATTLTTWREADNLFATLPALRYGNVHAVWLTTAQASRLQALRLTRRCRQPGGMAEAERLRATLRAEFGLTTHHQQEAA